MFFDELTLQVAAGSGGDGLAHFARRKYQAFGGPDGGDGGPGGDVVLVGSRAVDSLAHLRTVDTTAPDGGPGGPNLMAGSRAPDLELSAPLGTLAYDLSSGAELGAVTASDQRLVIANGGRGGRGNTKFATAQRRAPKLAESGRRGDELTIELEYRIYADTMLIEPAEPDELTVLPQVLERDPLEVDYALYTRKPRWLRVQHDYRLYDTAYLPLEAEPGQVLLTFERHVYWAQALFVNLLSLEDQAGAWQVLHARLLELPLRRLERLTVCAAESLFAPWTLETEGEGDAAVVCVTADTPQAVLAAYHDQLTGGVVE